MFNKIKGTFFDCEVIFVVLVALQKHVYTNIKASDVYNVRSKERI
jgi:hypothetical protein